MKKEMTGHPMQNRIYREKEHYIRDLVAGLYITEISKDFSQTDQFHLKLYEKWYVDTRSRWNQAKQNC